MRFRWDYRSLLARFLVLILRTVSLLLQRPRTARRTVYRRSSGVSPSRGSWCYPAKAMEMNETKLAVDQILHEECQRPTTYYEDVANEWVQRYKELTPEEIEAWTK